MTPLRTPGWVLCLALIPVLTVLVLVPADAEIGVQTPSRPEGVELTIYRQGDLTLVRERHHLTLHPGRNHFRFRWGGSAIDPTSIRFQLLDETGRFRVREQAFPPGETGVLQWVVEADRSGTVPVEISYFTSGLDWDAIYHGVMGKRERSLDLTSHVRVHNRSPERFEQARIRLFLGEVRILETIASILKKWNQRRSGKPAQPRQAPAAAESEALFDRARKQMLAAPAARQPAPSGEAVTEYYVFELPDTATLPPRQIRRVPLFRTPVERIRQKYEFQPEQNDDVQRSLLLRNQSESNLGGFPLPPGPLQLMKQKHDRQVSLVGQPRMPYVAIGDTLHLNLGPTERVTSRRVVARRWSDQFQFDSRDNLIGWNRYERFRIPVRNHHDTSVVVDVLDQFPDGEWSVLDATHSYRKLSYNRLRFRVRVEPGESQTILYTIRQPVGRSSGETRRLHPQFPESSRSTGSPVYPSE